MIKLTTTQRTPAPDPYPENNKPPSQAGVDASYRAVLGKHRDTPPCPVKVTPRKHRSRIRQSTAAGLVAGYWRDKGENLKGSSVVGCGRWKAFGADSLTAEIEVTGDRASMSGHFVCGCNWTCEPCAAATVARNRGWLRGALFPALKARELTASMVTLSIAHSYGAPWSLSVDSLKVAYTLMDRRLAKVYAAAGSVGKFKAMEVTIGVNGLHPHMHVLVTHRLDADVARLEATMREAWFKAVSEAGATCTERGFDFKTGMLSDYVAKMEAAHEMASQSTKQGRRKGRTLSQTLDAAGRGDYTAGVEWRRAIEALGSTNRFHSGALAKNLGIPTPSEYQDDREDEAEQTETVAPVRIVYPLTDHLTATHSALGRNGLAMILRAAERGGEVSALRMVAALCRDSQRKNAGIHRTINAICSNNAVGILKTAHERPLSRDEVEQYLRAKRQMEQATA